MGKYMTKRPVFIPSNNGTKFVKEIDISFKWHAGFSVSQKQKSIQEFHSAITKETELTKILEISTKSENDLGVKTSAFNLKLSLNNGEQSSVESFYQGSKIFENGGPYTDMYKMNAYESKKDDRLKKSSELIGFSFYGIKWGINDNFYDWLYLNALIKNESISNKLMDYECFTDIEFNPKKSYNCQGYSAALFVSMKRRGMNVSLVQSKKGFSDLLPKESLKSFQMDLF